MKNSFLRMSLFVAMLGACGSSWAQNIYTYAGSGTAGYAGDGGYAGLSQLNGPRGAVTDIAGNTYFCDSRNNVVRKITAAGIISTVAGNGTAGYGGDGGAATAAQLTSPCAVAVDATGNLYIADANNNVIRKVTTGGTISTIAGTGTPAYSGDGGAATIAELDRPQGIAIDAAGNIYFSDTRNYAVRKITAAGIISTIAGTGTAGYTGDGAAATAATLQRPQGLALDATNNLYVADNISNAVRKISTAGIISTVAGSGTAGFSGDGGAATAAMLRGPYGVAIDATGNLLIADYQNNRVRKVTTAGTITTIAGNGVAGYSGDGGAAVSAEVNGPIAVSLDAGGNIYVSDYFNNAMRRIGAAVTSITVNTVHGDTICTGGVTHFAATAFADAHPHYRWVVNGVTVGTDSTGYTTSTLALGDVIYCVLLDSAGTTPIAMSATFVANSVPAAGIITGPNVTCAGGTIVLRDTASRTGGGRWVASDSLIGRVIPPGRVFALSAGIDTIYFIKANACGADTASFVLNIMANNIGAIHGPAAICAGDTVTFTDTTARGMWRTRPGGFGPTGTIDSVTGFFTAGMTQGYVPIAYTTGPGCVVLDSIMVDSLPVVAPISGPTSVHAGLIITLTDATPGGVWSSQNTGIAIANATTGAVTGIAPGVVIITYSVTNSAGCEGFATTAIRVDSTTGISNIRQVAGIDVFPNPAANNVTISWTAQNIGNAAVVIRDVTGRIVLNKEVVFTAGKGNATLALDALTNGIYMMSINTADGVYTTKLTVSK